MEKIAEPRIVWEDQEMLVLDKPAGMVTVRAESVKGETVQDWVEKNIELDGERGNEEERQVFKERLGLAHRLDKETSGALMVAKNPESLARLMDQLRKRKIKKEYLTLLHGWLEPKEGRVKLPLARLAGYKQEVRFDGKMADSEWEVKEKYGGVNDEQWQGVGQWGEKLSLVKVKIHTGRMHQIRVHMAHLSFPVFGDSKYLSEKQRQFDRLLLKRHFLHAKEIEFETGKGEKQEVTVEMGRELKELLAKLKS